MRTATKATVSTKGTATVTVAAQQAAALAQAATTRAAMHAALAQLHTQYKLVVPPATASPAAGLRTLVTAQAQPKYVASGPMHAAFTNAIKLAQTAVYARRVVRTLRPAKLALGRVASYGGLTLLQPTAQPVAPAVASKGKVAKVTKGKVAKAAKRSA